MGKKVEKEKNEIVEEFFRRNDPKNIKSMSDMYAAWKDFFAPAFQQLLDAEMEAKIGYSKNERTDNNNYRNGYYPERTVATEMGDIPVKVPRDRNGEIESDLVPKYSRTANGFDEKVISMYALGMSDKDWTFWCRGFYVSTVGNNKTAVYNYVQNQLKEDMMSDQITIKEYKDPFKG